MLSQLRPCNCLMRHYSLHCHLTPDHRSYSTCVSVPSALSYPSHKSHTHQTKLDAGKTSIVFFSYQKDSPSSTPNLISLFSLKGKFAVLKPSCLEHMALLLLLLARFLSPSKAGSSQDSLYQCYPLPRGPFTGNIVTEYSNSQGNTVKGTNCLNYKLARLK